MPGTVAPRERKKRKRKEAVVVEWERLEDAETMVRQLIEKHHKHLERATVLCLGKPKASKRGDRAIVAKARKVTKAMNALLKGSDVGEAHYLIEVGLDVWKGLDREKKRIALDVALMYLTGQDDKGSWGTTWPDFEGFNEEVRRHGAWRAELELAAKEFRQLTLDLRPPGE
jgi:putative metallopeptidase